MGAGARGPEMSSPESGADCGQESGKIAPAVDFTRCEGKGDCVRVCPESVFELRRIDLIDYRGLPLLNKINRSEVGAYYGYYDPH